MDTSFTSNASSLEQDSVAEGYRCLSHINVASLGHDYACGLTNAAGRLAADLRPAS
jgi:hypothetical protein